MTEKKMTVLYFASLKEQTDKESEEIVTVSKTPSELFHELNQTYHFPIGRDHLRVAINDEFMPFDTPLNEGDTVIFIPPVSGG